MENENRRPIKAARFQIKLRNANLPSSLGGFGLQRGLGDFDQLAESGVVSSRKISDDFAVQRDLRSLESFHKSAVGQTGGAGGGVDANLPEHAEIPLLGFAVAEGVLASVIERVGGVTVKFGAAHSKAFGGFDRADAAFAGSGSVGNSHGLLIC